MSDEQFAFDQLRGQKRIREEDEDDMDRYYWFIYECPYGCPKKTWSDSAVWSATTVVVVVGVVVVVVVAVVVVVV